MDFIEKGSPAYVYWERAGELRERLRRPANAVEDHGINLKQSRPQPVVVVKKHDPGVMKPQDHSLLKHYKELPSISVNEIRRATSLYFNLSIDEINGSSRRSQIILARHLAVYLARSRTTRSWHEIAPFFGHRDHTTLLHSWKKISTLVRIGNLEITNHVNSIWNIIHDYRRELALSTQPEQHLAVELENQEGISGPSIRSVEEAGSFALDGGATEGICNAKSTV